MLQALNNETVTVPSDSAIDQAYLDSLTFTLMVLGPCFFVAFLCLLGQNYAYHKVTLSMYNALKEDLDMRARWEDRHHLEASNLPTVYPSPIVDHQSVTTTILFALWM